ncbi:hypothetical protein C7441_105249 [Pseudaminobacter salicylatoxidans]|uniref:Uncharacterized protein n=1 Tax=Pseudaminobacter salicylatoxidans TaxID=93369 RepID=A0A316C4K1_PSESE|nr:hypothetical protein C7441_105249 [Pseudaminobacter salicylatoxidans]
MWHPATRLPSHLIQTTSTEAQARIACTRNPSPQGRTRALLPAPALELLIRRIIRPPSVSSAAAPLMHDAEPVGTGETAVGECAPPASPHRADRCVYHRAGRLRPDRTALAAVNDAEAIGTRQACVGEGARTVCALSAYRRIFEAAHLRTRGGRTGTGWRGNTGRQDACDHQQQGCWFDAKAAHDSRSL